jgi:hypothetical protein
MRELARRFFTVLVAILVGLFLLWVALRASIP